MLKNYNATICKINMQSFSEKSKLYKPILVPQDWFEIQHRNIYEKKLKIFPRRNAMLRLVILVRKHSHIYMSSYQGQ